MCRPSKFPSATTGHGYARRPSRSRIISIAVHENCCKEPSTSALPLCASSRSPVGERIHHRARDGSFGRVRMIAEQLLQREARVDAIAHLHESLRFAQERRPGEAATRETHHEVVELKNRLVIF